MFEKEYTGGTQTLITASFNAESHPGLLTRPPRPDESHPLSIKTARES